MSLVGLLLTNGGVNSAVPQGCQALASGPSRVSISDQGPVAGVLANGGQYCIIPGTTPANWKLKVYATAGTEYAAGAMTADILTDTILAEVDWAR